MLDTQNVTIIGQLSEELGGIPYGTTINEPFLSSTDAQFLERLRLGEAGAFEELVNRFQGIIYGLAYRLLNNHAEASDITQETFLKIHRSVSSFRGQSELKTWIYRIVINQITNRQRWWNRRFWRETVSIDEKSENRKSLCDQIASQSNNPEQQTLLLERQRQLERALLSIKFEFRLAVILRDIKGFSYEEIAETLQISIGTVKSRIARGREELRRKLVGNI